MMSNKTKIKNIIFDFGGVLSVLDINISRRRFIELGVTNIDDYLDITAQKGFFGQLEDGSLSADEFCRRLSELTHRKLTLEQCAHAWRGFIVDIPKRGLVGLRQLRAQGYHLSLLSNTNPFVGSLMHDANFDGEQHPLTSYFDATYLSYEQHLMKPDLRFFKRVLDEQHYAPAQTLLVDDSPVNCAAAQQLGVNTYQPANGENWPALIARHL